MFKADYFYDTVAKSWTPRIQENIRFLFLIDKTTRKEGETEREGEQQIEHKDMRATSLRIFLRRWLRKRTAKPKTLWITLEKLNERFYDSSYFRMAKHDDVKNESSLSPPREWKRKHKKNKRSNWIVNKKWRMCMSVNSFLRLNMTNTWCGEEKLFSHSFPRKHKTDNVVDD